MAVTGAESKGSLRVRLYPVGRRVESPGPYPSVCETSVILRRSLPATLSHPLDGHDTVCADDSRAAVACPKGVNPKCFGVVQTELAKLGTITKVGSKNTRRPQGHPRPVYDRGLVDATAARQRLAKHPDIEIPYDGTADGGDDDHAEPAATA